MKARRWGGGGGTSDFQLHQLTSRLIHALVLSSVSQSVGCFVHRTMASWKTRPLSIVRVVCLTGYCGRAVF